MSDFKKLLVWQKAHALALIAHRIAARIRGTQNTTLRNQITRAAQSISANIVEGRGQRSEKEFARFLGYALNSAAELEHHMIVARDLAAVTAADFAFVDEKVTEVRKMLHALIARVTRSPSPAQGQAPS